MTGYFFLLFGAVFVNNIVLSQFLGVCPFFGVSKKIESALGMGLAVSFVMGFSSVISWLINSFVLVPLQVEYLRTITFILVIASLVQLVEIILLRFSSSLHKSLGIYLPLITTNCAVLGIALLNIQKGYTLGETIVNTVGNAAGFTLALLLFAAIRERLEMSDIPKTMQGNPIILITAGLMSIAFLGFTGILK